METLKKRYPFVLRDWIIDKKRRLMFYDQSNNTVVERDIERKRTSLILFKMSISHRVLLLFFLRKLSNPKTVGFDCWSSFTEIIRRWNRWAQRFICLFFFNSFVIFIRVSILFEDHFVVLGDHLLVFFFHFSKTHSFHINCPFNVFEMYPGFVIMTTKRKETKHNAYWKLFVFIFIFIKIQ